jgi:hypothetical protein
MDRKQAIIGAATIAGGLLAASSAYALSGGIVANHGGDGAGRLSPVVQMAPTGGPATTAPPTTAKGEVEHREHGVEHEAGDVEGREDDD